MRIKTERITSRGYPKALPSNKSDAKTKIMVTFTPIKNISVTPIELALKKNACE